MKWILTIAILCVSSVAFADLPLASDRLPLASDRHKHKKHQEEKECCDVSYRWVACSDPSQVALFADGKQVGNYRGGHYYPLNGDTWGKACTMPAGCSPPSFSTAPATYYSPSSEERFRIFGGSRIFHGGRGRRGSCSGGG